MVAHGSVSVSGEINTVCVEQGRNFLDFILFYFLRQDLTKSELCLLFLSQS